MQTNGTPVSEVAPPTDVWESKETLTLVSDRSGVHIELMYRVQRSLLHDKKRILIQAITSADEQAWEFSSVREAERKWKELTRPIVQLNS